MRILRGAAFGLLSIMGIAGLIKTSGEVEAETAVTVPAPVAITSQLLENG